MKTKLILALASMLLFVTGLRAATPYVVYCEGDQSLHFLTADAKPEGSLDGQNITYMSELKQEENYAWNSMKTKLTTTVFFENSFKEVKPTNCYQWFGNFKYLTQIVNLDNLDTSEVTDMSAMFMGCSSLTSLDMSSFVTSNVTDMGCMFSNCSSLTSLDLSNFDTANVTVMNSMFYGCSSLTSLDLSNFDTANVTNMSSMFNNCSSLTSLDLSNFDTANVTNMSSMFDDCSGLTSLNLSSFDTSNMTNMSYMFCDCKKLTSLDLSSFNTSKVESMDGMFRQSSGLEIIYVSDKFSTQRVTISLSMFMGCTKLRNFKSTNIDDITYANYGKDGYFSYLGPFVVFDSDSKKLTFKNGEPADDAFYILNQGSDTPGWNSISAQIEKVVFDESFTDIRPTSCYKWFSGCTQLTIEGLEYLNISNVSDVDVMFADCNDLRMVDLSNKTSETTNTNTNNICSIIASLIPQNALVFVPADTEVDDERVNVVVGGNCANFVINYGTTENNQNLLKIPYGFTAEKVTINRVFTKDTPYSLYLPFGMSGTDFGTFYTYTGHTETTVQFDPVTGTTEAHTPYMLLPTDDYADGIVIEGQVTVETTPENAGTETDGYIGVYEKKNFTEDDEAAGVYYGWVGTGFYRAGAGASVDACRAYLKLPSNAAFKAPARIAAKFGDNGLTGISDINSDETTTDSPCYDLNGRRVTDSYRGIVIKDRRKFINPGL